MKNNSVRRVLLGLVIICFSNYTLGFGLQDPPNVILVMTDDQGIGDLSCHGNPFLKTPNLNQFAGEAVSLTNFHVSPLCTPTRSAIITGQYPVRNGAWATFKGRASLQKGAPSIARAFKQNGYTTALIGKWHLGDNYPARPTDMGFDFALHHLSGGIGEITDYWGNDYYDDVYFENNEPKQFEGYCTDVWFQEAMRWIENRDDKPFFLYLPTNAPHSPLRVPETYAAPYRAMEGTQIISADYLGMLANIDENFGKLDRFLEAEGLAENTIVIFCSDNGTQYGHGKGLGYDMGYSGSKGSALEGGHRVPFFIRWPKGQLIGGKKVAEPVAHVDLLPTLASLAHLTLPDDWVLDGLDISPLFQREAIPDREIFIHHRQDWRAPEGVAKSAVISGEWRLLNGNQLYDMTSDQRQERNVAQQHPEVVNRLLAAHQAFWVDAFAATPFHQLPPAGLGYDAQEEVVFTIQHAIGDDGPLWKQEQVAEGVRNQNAKHIVDVAKNGTYEVELRRWPKENPGPIGSWPADTSHGLPYRKITPKTAHLQIGDLRLSKSVDLTKEVVRFRLPLKTGVHQLTAQFADDLGRYGVYYVYLRNSN
ncbi:arylsulfatase [Marinoscillum furvescens]|uniref:Arylsulfatase A-like enzyme n=1 Tax=Marinoscillum furvescens DSM 4134 TaxID=1122208 RepID=A0A3D9L010_MARFU|nr:arylsulfatase [Marinoscillum furvescens]RED95243.1 arylsulfatase A-like enzyme [Marinoscillum furvescens DSM 4134]